MRPLVCLLVLTSFAAASSSAQLAAGDIAIIAFNTHDPDNFAWVPLRDIPPHTRLSFTDSSVSNGWLRWSEHFKPVTGPAGPLTWESSAYLMAGTVVRWEGSGLTNWSIGQACGAGPSLANTGDQLFAYQGEITNNASQPDPWYGDPAGAVFLYGLNFANAGWNNVTGGDPSTSFVPPGLSTNCGTAVHVTDKKDGYFSGPLCGSASQLRQAIASPTNWTTGSAAFNASNWPVSFKVLGIERGMVISVQ